MAPAPWVPLLLSLLFASAPPVPPQTTTQAAPRDPQAILVLQKSLSVLVPGAPVNDITLTATAHSIAGSLDESGEATLEGLASGSSRVDLNLSSGQTSEVRSVSSDGVPTGSWSGPSGTAHTIPQHNLMTDATWFYPAFYISRTLRDTSYAVSAADTETRDGQAVEHIRVYRPALTGTVAQVAAMIQNLSQMDLYLDATTLLPVAVEFDVHADMNALVDIPIEVRFSNWQASGGAMVPFRVQKFLNSGLALDLQITSAALNTGLQASSFSVE
jgi:hypothetical protein